jgi:LCP family protein required for cell wall assembly
MTGRAAEHSLQVMRNLTDAAILWIRRHPVKFSVSVFIGIVLAVVLFVYDLVAGAFASAAEDFDAAAAASELAGRSSSEVERSVAEFLAAEEDRLRAEYEQQLQGAALDDEVERQIEELHNRTFEVPNAISPRLPDDMFTSMLLIGADESGFLADVIIDILLPADGSAPMIVSLPRDLYLPNACTDAPAKLNASLGGCRGFASGSELLAINVGSFTGVAVDHYARVNFAGFAALVDRLGGLEICVGDRPVRDIKANILEPIGPGCLVADGATALGWVRSRHPEFLTAGEWVTENGSDFIRQQRQQDLLFQMAERLAQYSSLGALTEALSNLSSVVRMDAGFTVSEAASIGFRYRSLGRDGIIRFGIPVSDMRTRAGGAVLIPTKTFNEVLGSVYPPARAG